jgi:hypothetical protein
VKNIVLWDLDNTIRNIDHRLHYLKREDINWREFEEQCVYDLPIMPTIVMMRAVKALGKLNWIWTGCSDHVKAETEVWLHRHQVPYDQLIMKSLENDEETPVLSLKKRWLNVGPVIKERVICAFDDDPSIVKGLRNEGLLVYQVVRPTEEE